MRSSFRLLVCLTLTCLVAADSTPTALLDDATFVGSTDGVTNKFLGIPYAQPPIGQLRFSRPQPIERYTGTYAASEFGPWCPQQYIAPLTTFPPALDLGVTVRLLNSVLNASAPQSEDCMRRITLVALLEKKSDHNCRSQLEYMDAAGCDYKVRLACCCLGKGGFQDGGSALYDGGIIVERAVQLSEPIIVVSINYRLSALGWITGKEARDARVGNLGYRDQRLAFRWGESAGAMSAAAHMLTNGGNNDGLFRGAYMQSGSLLPFGDVQGAQVFYDGLVADAGCEGAIDTLQCLRHIPFDRLKAAIDMSPSFFSFQSLATSWFARHDGNFLPKSPYELAEEGSIAKVPVVTGVCEGEGTVFALTSLNITTAEELHDWLSTYFFVNASSAEINGLLTAYPEDPSLGSPFNTGLLNTPTPQFKRIAAFLGDMMFEAPRKAFVEAMSGNQDVWTYMTRRRKNTAILGSAHVTDLFDMFGPSDMTDHLIHFVNYLDPNGPPGLANQTEGVFNDTPHTQAPFDLGGPALFWPKYDSMTKTKLIYMDGAQPLGLAEDTDREEQLGYIADFLKGNPVR
ncbi:hypothetical protein EUX98_g6289 [Antrodiella citrinella]|uniref:Carboxylesterase type B domain-containing protein n=1 Tax=Antrodiella citrinella TaxID=2447956 RepID=A0A4S4MR77_9APHY|nr:hypothetical protein EUX98_g6289 [Antrodiella citrinella]